MSRPWSDLLARGGGGGVTSMWPGRVHLSASNVSVHNPVSFNHGVYVVAVNIF